MYERFLMGVFAANPANVCEEFSQDAHVLYVNGRMAYIQDNGKTYKVQINPDDVDSPFEMVVG